MKKLLFIAMLFIALSATAQKVDIFDLNGKKLNVEPVERHEIPDKFDHLPDGKYYLQYWDDRENGHKNKTTKVPMCPIYKEQTFKTSG